MSDQSTNNLSKSQSDIIYITTAHGLKTLAAPHPRNLLPWGLVQKQMSHYRRTTQEGRSPEIQGV